MSAVDFTAANLLAPQLAFLQGAGYDVQVACGRTSDEHWSSLESFSPVDLSFPRSLKPTEMLRSALNLRSFVNETRPDILHLHTPAASLPIRALPRRAWPSSLRIVYTVHGYLHRWPPTGRRERIIQRVEQAESRRTDLTFFQSAEDLSEAVARDYRGSPTYLGNGVGDDWFIAPSRPQRGAELELAFVGRLVREKGILDLLAALRATSGVRLHVAGSALPSDRDAVTHEVEAMARELGDRVQLYGMLDKQHLQALIGRVDAFCLPSYREGVPRSVIEALAMGKPVIGSRIRGTRELVTHDENGLLFAAGDVQDLCGQLVTMRDLPAERFGALSRAARSRASGLHRESQVFDRLLTGYETLL